MAISALGQEGPPSGFEPIPYRPRIAEVTVSSLYNYPVVSDKEVLSNRRSEVELDRKIKLRLGIPIVMKEKTLFGVQLKYDNHDFVLDMSNNNFNELYRHIKGTHFKSYGGRLLLQHQFDENKNFTVLTGTEIKSDKNTWDWNTNKTYLGANYLIEKDEGTTYGAGFIVSYALKAFSIYPLLFVEKKLTPQWTLDLALPKSIIMRYRVHEGFYASFKTEVNGWRYAVHNEELSEQPLTLRKADLNIGINLEHEIHDWLWLGADGGLAINMRNYLARPGDRSGDAIYQLKSSNAPYLRFGLFIVPPKKLYR